MRGSIKTRNTQVQFIRQGFRRNCSSELKQKEMNKNGERNIIARLYRKDFRHVFQTLYVCLKISTLMSIFMLLF